MKSRQGSTEKWIKEAKPWEEKAVYVHAREAGALQEPDCESASPSPIFSHLP